MERLRALAAHVANPTAAGKAAVAEPRYVDDRSRESNDRAKRYTAGAVLSDQEAHEQLHGEFVRRGADGPIAEETFFEFPASGLFVDDYSKLPQPTTDVEKAKSDIDLYGYCMFDQAMAPEKVKAIAEALMDSDGNVRGGSSMFNSGELFTSLYDHPWFREIGAHVVGGDSHHAQVFVAPIHKEGFGRRPLHTDTWWMPPPQRKSAPPRLRVGSVTRTNAFQDEWHNEDADWIIPSVRCPAIWMITDFTYSNGATVSQSSCRPVDLRRLLLTLLRSRR